MPYKSLDCCSPLCARCSRSTLPSLRSRCCPSFFLLSRHLSRSFSLPRRVDGVWFSRRGMVNWSTGERYAQVGGHDNRVCAGCALDRVQHGALSRGLGDGRTRWQQRNGAAGDSITAGRIGESRAAVTPGRAERGETAGGTCQPHCRWRLAVRRGRSGRRRSDGRRPGRTEAVGAGHAYQQSRKPCGGWRRASPLAAGGPGRAESCAPGFLAVEQLDPGVSQHWDRVVTTTPSRPPAARPRCGRSGRRSSRSSRPGERFPAATPQPAA